MHPATRAPAGGVQHETARRVTPKRPGSLWTVFDPEGRVLGFVETPEGLWIWEIGEDYILGRADDELGVESVQLWPLERRGG